MKEREGIELIEGNVGRVSSEGKVGIIKGREGIELIEGKVGIVN